MPIDRDRYRRSFRHKRPYDHGEPLRWMGLVPLAGVLAIAGALIASSYGIKPHALLVDFPVPGYYDDTGPLTPDVDRLTIAASGDLRWNGTRISDAELTDILRQVKRRESRSGLLFTPEPDVTYARAVEVLAIIRREGLLDRCFRFSGIERYRAYDRPETFDDPVLAQREDCPPLPPGV